MDLVRIFISYRRADTSDAAGRLRDRLVQEFDSGNVFFDVTSIDPGRDFRDKIEDAVQECDVFLAVIGSSWMEQDAKGCRRLEDPADLVRTEISVALRQGIRVIPVLIGGADPPASQSLPPDIAPIARLNAVRLRHETFDIDIQSLIRALEPTPRAVGWRRWREAARQQRLWDAADLVADDVHTLEATILAQLVGDSGATRAADLEFVHSTEVHWRTDGGKDRGSLSGILDYYRGLRRGRLVITGQSGSGKTVLAIALTSGLAAEFQSASGLASARTATQGPRARIAMRVSAPAFDPTGGLPATVVTADEVADRLDTWLARYLRSVSGIAITDATALVAEGWIVPVFDGVDEMDPPGPASPRAALLMAALNLPARSARGGLRPAVLTCRSDRYAALAALAGIEPASQHDRAVMQDATVVCIKPLMPAAARDYLLFRFPDPAGSRKGQPRWRPILAMLAAEAVPSAATPALDGGSRSATDAEYPLIVALRSPLRLFLVVHGYRYSGSEPRELATISDISEIDNHLFAKLIPAIVREHPRREGGRYTSQQVTRWLQTLAQLLDEADGSATDLQLNQLWRAAGPRLARYTTALILGLSCLVPFLSFRPLVQSVPMGLAASIVVAWTGTRSRGRLERLDIRVPRSRYGRRRLVPVMAVALVIGPAAGLCSWLTSMLIDGHSDTLAGWITVGIAATIIGGLFGGLSARPQAARSMRQLAMQGLAYAATTVLLLVAFGGALGAIVYGTQEGRAAALLVGYVGGLIVLAISPWPRYAVTCILLGCARRFPFRPAAIIDWACSAGLLRLAGLAVQFRHENLQAWLCHDALFEEAPISGAPETRGTRNPQARD